MHACMPSPVSSLLDRRYPYRPVLASDEIPAIFDAGNDDIVGDSVIATITLCWWTNERGTPSNALKDMLFRQCALPIVFIL